MITKSILKRIIREEFEKALKEDNLDQFRSYLEKPKGGYSPPSAGGVTIPNVSSNPFIGSVPPDGGPKDLPNTKLNKSDKKKKKQEEGNLNEAKETIFDVAARVLQNKQNENYKSSKGMVKLDLQTANLLVQVFKKVKPKMRKILSDLGYKNPAQLVQTLRAVIK